MEEQQQFEDKSGDRKYYVSLPNLIINGYTATESGVYSYIKRKSGENGEYFESAEKTSKNLHISKPTFLKIRAKLVKDGRLRFLGLKKTSGYPVKRFEVTDIWKENMIQYGKSKNKNAIQDSVKNTTTIASKIDTQKKNLSEEEPTNILSAKADPNFSFKEKLEELFKSDKKYIRIIAKYWEVKGYKFDNKVQYQSAFRRELRPAKKLEGYSEDRISKVMEWLEKNVDYAWKLETMHKYIDDKLDKLKPFSGSKQEQEIHYPDIKEIMKGK